MCALPSHVPGAAASIQLLIGFSASAPTASRCLRPAVVAFILILWVITGRFFLNAPFGNCKSRGSRSRSRCQLQSTAAGHASRTGREAAGLRSLLPASVCQELVLLPACWTPPRFFFSTPFPKLGGRSADPSPGRLRATVSRACGWQGAAQGRSCEYVAPARGFSADIGSAAKGKERRLAAKARAAREMLGPREAAGTALARRLAKSLTKVAASVLQRPPSSRARTIN